MFIALAVATLLLAGVLRYVGSRLYAVTAAVAFGLHLVASVVALRYLPYNWDIQTYHQTAINLLAGRPPDETLSTVAFGWVQAGLYTVFEPDVFVVAIFNALLAVLVALPVGAVARSLYPSLEHPHGVRTLVLFLPVSVLFLSLPMRDTLALALFAAALALVCRGIVGRYRNVIAAVPFVGVLAPIRVELAGLVAVGTILAAAVLGVERYADRSVSVPTLVLGVGVTGLVGFVPFSMRYDLTTLNYQLGIRATGGAAYLTSARYDSWLEVLAVAPVRAAYFQFAPFPLHVDGAFDLVAAAELPLLVVLAVAAVRSLHRREWSTPVGALLGLAYVGGVVGYGLVDANFGTTVRHRIPFVVLLVVFAAPVVERWWAALRRRVRILPGERDRDSDGDEKAGERERLAGP